MIEFSVPMMFSFEYLDYIIEINKKMKLSQITSVYNSLPGDSQDKSGFEQDRNYTMENVKTIDNFLEYANLYNKNGFKVIYLLNGVHGFNLIELKKCYSRLNVLLEKLISNGIKDVRVTNTQVIDYIIKNYPEISVYCSTSQEYTSLKQYNNLFDIFPQIKGVVPSWDNNKNFAFLKNFRTLFKDIEIELMINEGCLAGCPLRTHHNSSCQYCEEWKVLKNTRYQTFYIQECFKIIDNNMAKQICLSNVIYPWEIMTYYNKYDIKHFKIVGRNKDSNILWELKRTIFLEMIGIEDYDSIKEESFILLNHYISSDTEYASIKIKDIRDMLPKLEYFENMKYSCSQMCSADCKYCYESAKKIENKIPILKSK